MDVTFAAVPPQVARRPGPDGKPLSMGFGFVECDSEAAAKAAIKQLQVGGVCGELLLAISDRNRNSLVAVVSMNRAWRERAAIAG